MKKILIKFKRTKIFRSILLYFIKPFYDLIWEYIINFKGKIYYFLWFSKKRDFINLENNDKKLIFRNKKFNNLAEKIHNFCSENLLDTSTKQILEESFSKNNPTNSGGNKYSQDLFSRLPDDIQKEIFKLAQSDLLISTASKYLKVFPILDKVIMYHNIPNKPENTRGAMFWHKDDFGYKSLDFFMAVSDINELNGPLKVIKNKNQFGVFSKSCEENKSENSLGERGKIKFDYFEKIDEDNILTLKGDKGTALFIDSFTVYHRGGHCIKKDRLMLRFSYQTPDSVRVYRNNAYYEIFEKFNENLSLNFFLKFLYKERPSKFMIFLRNYLMKFYRIAHIKDI